METIEHIPVVMSIAGMDSCGGAGILADARAIEAAGCFGMAVVTAITAQNTVGVSHVWPQTREQVREQGYTLLSDIVPNAVKVGMLGDEQAARGVKDILLRYLSINSASVKGNIVVDTIIHSTSGAKLFDASGINPMLDIMKLARVITPNLPEARSIGASAAYSPFSASGGSISAPNGAISASDAPISTPTTTVAPTINYEQWARSLSAEAGGASVYLKGGHSDGDTLTDIFFNAETNEILHFTHPRVATNNTHGTGCTLSSALAGYLARGLSLNDAARGAAHFVFQSLTAGASLHLGHGHGPTYFGPIFRHQ